jgi:hypothetical protein
LARPSRSVPQLLPRHRPRSTGARRRRRDRLLAFVDHTDDERLVRALRAPAPPCRTASTFVSFATAAPFAAAAAAGNGAELATCALTGGASPRVHDHQPSPTAATSAAPTRALLHDEHPGATARSGNRGLPERRALANAPRHRSRPPNSASSCCRSSASPRCTCCRTVRGRQPERLARSRAAAARRKKRSVTAVRGYGSGNAITASREAAVHAQPFSGALFAVVRHRRDCARFAHGAARCGRGARRPARCTS